MDRATAPDFVEGVFRVNDRALSAPVTIAMMTARDEQYEASRKRDLEVAEASGLGRMRDDERQRNSFLISLKCVQIRSRRSNASVKLTQLHDRLIYMYQRC